jgi:hypothetical protein
VNVDMQCLFALTACALCLCALQVNTWQQRRDELMHKDVLASAGRAAVAAAVYAASGGCMLAPVIASFGVAFDELALEAPTLIPLC